MTKEKQIEEMAKSIFMNCHCGLFEDEAEMIAKWCYQEIERKANDVAREIFEEIEREIKNHGICYAQRKIAELKKKYTESEDTK